MMSLQISLTSKAIALGAPTMMNKPFPRIGNMMYWLDCVNFAGTTSVKKCIDILIQRMGWRCCCKTQKRIGNSWI